MPRWLELGSVVLYPLISALPFIKTTGLPCGKGNVVERWEDSTEKNAIAQVRVVETRVSGVEIEWSELILQKVFC